jgi:hypothetical protein
MPSTNSGGAEESKASDLNVATTTETNAEREEE